MIDGTERARTMAAALQISVLVRASAFAAAHAARARLLTRLTAVSGVGTLLDTRRYEDYDAGKAVDQYLNLPEVRAALSVNESLYGKEKKKYKEKKNEKNGGRVEADPPPSLPSPYAACSDSVALAMDADVMRSTARLFPDILDSGVRVLVYVGADDVQYGSAATDAWLSRLKWSGSKDFSRSPRRLWELVGAVVDDERYGSGCTEAGGSVGSGVAAGAGFVEMGVLVGVEERVSSPFLNPSSSSPPAPVVGYWRSGGGLDHVTVRNGGHMLPHDQPVVALAMLARWSAEVLSSGSGSSLSSSSSSSVAA
jgi:vitellogenic carboxypeptidase-like protein